MPLINTSLPNLIQGVSQQPDALRYDGQCEEQENALSSVVDGLVKRPNTRHVARLLEEAISADSFVHFIDRTDAEKYVVIHDGTKIRTFNLISGSQGTVDGASSYTPVSGDYLYTTNPREDLKALTIGDSTFIVNTTKTVSESPDVTTSPSVGKAVLFVAQGDYEKAYDVEILMPSTLGITLTPATTTVASFSPADTFEHLQVDHDALNIHNQSLANRTEDYTSNTYANAEQVTSFTVSGQDGIFFSSSTPAKIWHKRPQSNLSDWYVDVTDGYDIVYDDSEGQLVSITAKAGTPDETFIGHVLNIEGNPQGGWSDAAEYIVTGTSQVLTATNLYRSFKSGASSSGEAADTSKITYFIVTGFSRDTSKDTFGASSTNGDFEFYQMTPDGNKYNSLQFGRGSTFFLENNAGAQFNANAHDGLAGGGLKLVYKEVDSISSLPVHCEKGFTVKVKGDPELNEDDYYVSFETNSGQAFGEGAWGERAGYAISKGLDGSTMPHRLINSSPNVFTVSAVDYSERGAGDNNTNPQPSFVNNKIQNLFLYKNRLGFLSNENVIMSAAGDLFNFYRKTVTTLLDDAPIDVSVASGRVLNLEDAVGFQENLILFGDNGQFVLKGGDLLTPKTVSVTPITSYDYDGSVNPLALGSYIYFPFSRGSFTGVREFSTSATTDTYDSVEVSDHVPRYVPSNLIGMAGTTSEDIIALLSGDEPNALYVYNYFWNGNQKLLSAWSKFTFKGDIRGLQFIDSTLYLVTVHNGETNLEALPLESGLKDPVGYNTYLDQRIEATVLNGNDTITLPYTPASSDEIQVYTKDGLKLSSSRIGSTVTLTQAVSGDTDVWVGYPYEMRYTFSELLFKAAAGNSKSPSNAAKLKVRNGSLFYNDSAYFKVSVTPLYRDTYENVFTPDVVGSTTLGELNLDSGAYRFPVFSNAEDTKITITNDSALPSNITSAEFESFVHSRSNRYAG